MYVSLYDIRDAISDYQISLLLYTTVGGVITTNEGNSFRAWLEIEGVEQKGVRIRKDSCDKLLSWGLIELIPEEKTRLFHYRLSVKGRDLLSMLSPGKVTYLRSKIRWDMSEK